MKKHIYFLSIPFWGLTLLTSCGLGRHSLQVAGDPDKQSSPAREEEHQEEDLQTLSTSWSQVQQEVFKEAVGLGHSEKFAFVFAEAYQGQINQGKSEAWAGAYASQRTLGKSEEEATAFAKEDTRNPSNPKGSHY